MKKQINIKSLINIFSEYLTIIVVVLIIIYLWIKMKGTKNETEKKQESITDELNVKGSGLSNSQANLYADNLEKAMQRNNNYGGYDGTDELTINNVLISNIYNPKNLTHIYKAFGSREKKTTLFTIKKLNLDGWFKDELSTEDYNKVKKLWNYYNNDIKFS